MKFRTALHAGLYAGAALLSLGSARAQEVTPTQTAALEALLRSWYSMSRAVIAAPTPYRVTPAGDHLDVVAPIRLLGPARGNLQMTATAKPGENGRWSFAQVKTSLPFQVMLDVPVPPKEGEKGPAKVVPVTYVVDAASQDATIDYDPSFSTPSLWASSLKGMSIHAIGAGMDQSSLIDQAEGRTTLTPSGADRIDLVTSADVAGYKMDMKAGPDTPAILATIDTLKLSGTVTGVSRERMGKLYELAFEIGALAGKAPPGAPPKMPPGMMATLIANLQGVASEMNLVETFQGTKLNVGGMDFVMDELKFGLVGKSDDGLLRASMDMGFDGLHMPDLGLGDMEQLVPRKFFVRPYVSGIPVADVGRIAVALNDKRDPSPAELKQLFSHGGVVSGVEALTLDLGGTVFSGDSKVTMTSPQDYTATARLTAENFDALVQRLGAIPMAQQAMPVVIFLKGIGKQDGGKLVWDVSYAGDKLLVNNIDLSAMTGGPKPAPPPPATTGGAPKAPAPRPQNRTR